MVAYLKLAPCANGEQLTATEGHPFKTTEGWRDAVMLKKGGKLLLKGGDESSEPAIEITEIRTERKTLPVYNIEVANAHTYFVGIDGVGGAQWEMHSSNEACLGEATRKRLATQPNDRKNSSRPATRWASHSACCPRMTPYRSTEYHTYDTFSTYGLA